MAPSNWCWIALRRLWESPPACLSRKPCPVVRMRRCFRRIRPHYQLVFDSLIEALESRSPIVEKGELGCAYVDLRGLEEMYGGEARLIATLLQAVPHWFNPRIGVAAGKFPAYVAAVTSNGGRATKAPDNAAEFLQGFP